MSDADKVQVGGSHYASKKIQPWAAMEEWMSREEFVHMLTAELPERPGYFALDAEINRALTAGPHQANANLIRGACVGICCVHGCLLVSHQNMFELVLFVNCGGNV